jgi:hypothetical protein
MPGLRRLTRRFVCAALLLQTMGLAGCAPMLLLSALLGGTGGGDHAPANTGPLQGSPSAVQNALPTDTSVQKALALDHSVDSACLGELGEQPPLPETGCATRPTCVPGAKHPLLLRVCGGKLAASEPASITPALPSPTWIWDARD